MHRKATICGRYIGNIYCARTKNIFLTVNQKILLCTDREAFPDITSEMCTLHRQRTLSWRYIRNVYCAQTKNPFQTLHQNVYCVQTKNPFKAVYQKYVLCTETQHFTYGTSEMCTVHRNTTFPRRYIRNVYCAQGTTLSRPYSDCCFYFWICVFLLSLVLFDWYIIWFVGLLAWCLNDQQTYNLTMKFLSRFLPMTLA